MARALISSHTVILGYFVHIMEIRANGSMKVTVIHGYNDGPTFIKISGQEVELTAIQAATILDSQATPGMTRHNDLNSAVEQWLLTNNYLA